MKGAKARLLALLLLVAVTLTGCWDLEEIDRRTVVLGLAFDTDRGGGFRMVASVPDPRALVPSGGTAIGPQVKEPAFVVLQTRGRTASENLAALRDVTSRDLFLGQILVIGVSERLARRGVLSLLEFLMNNTDIPRAAWFVVARGDPARVLAVKPPQQTFPEFYLDDVFRARGKPTGALAIPYWRVWVDTLLPGRDALVPVVAPGPQGQMRVAQVAAFRDSRMVGLLSEKETHLLALIRDARNTFWEVDLPDGRRIALRPLGANTRILPLSPGPGGRPRFRFEASLNMALVEVYGATGSPPELLQQAASHDLTLALTRLVRRLQQMGSDPLGFGERWRIAQPRLFQVRDWHQQWPQAQVDVRVRVNIGRGGAFH
ncbi:Ger(x)C family spore germination protein [Thermaerobacter subterraneus]|uniref:Germination protein, Ger(X)C family n=1 Tax=Thermaerobacter subterraneus DSM 13965 TaxID=867903 RepID=K6QFK4_9FIRM|nr:Ger(x)C family spore germination protein [Thermaerobacter subterraneus]EKP95816.1 germination protein, Ger(X)C family [Thermaerobacter subterraneus DSM 13965]